ncbi:hypothetical protein [Nitrospirillum sp. BR 11163]|uniref:hypothetical protein n=1 Tax=Nitrospirillum sp. BR 11163 TaxID=3104323 RepID=UPI002AFE20B9|nr:hypothetical protein [Nitrospirillum sp. BR 11163]MEA1674095.1 hypothetical protein [Nitrospirillum sp. BR 11163]
MAKTPDAAPDVAPPETVAAPAVAAASDEVTVKAIATLRLGTPANRITVPAGSSASLPRAEAADLVRRGLAAYPTAFTSGPADVATRREMVKAALTRMSGDPVAALSAFLGWQVELSDLPEDVAAFLSARAGASE